MVFPASGISPPSSIISIATPAIWLNALGISAIIGIALYLSVREPGKAPPDRWTAMRLFLMPFCVSSFSQLIKGKGFVLVFPPDPHEIAVSLAACAVFVIRWCSPIKRLTALGIRSA